MPSDEIHSVLYHKKKPQVKKDSQVGRLFCCFVGSKFNPDT